MLWISRNQNQERFPNKEKWKTHFISIYLLLSHSSVNFIYFFFSAKQMETTSIWRTVTLFTWQFVIISCFLAIWCGVFFLKILWFCIKIVCFCIIHITWIHMKLPHCKIVVRPRSHAITMHQQSASKRIQNHHGKEQNFLKLCSTGEKWSHTSFDWDKSEWLHNLHLVLLSF